jgi:dipeptidyl aminopeptidase/acylaminoacyl peptidase
MRRVTALMLAITLFGLGGCASVDFSLIHPAEAPADVVSWSEETRSGELAIRYEWAAPQGLGPFPTVVVQPGIDTAAHDLRAILWDLASRGYLAVAIDYGRVINGESRQVRFPLRNAAEISVLLEPVRAEPRVDPTRMGLLGFSRGAAYSLLLAAEVPEFRAAVAYYPITDFERWVDEREQRSAIWRLAFTVARWQFRSEGHGLDDSDLRGLLKQSSAINRAQDIRTPVLFIHGDRDSVAPLRDSVSLNALLNERCDCSKLIVVRNGDHSFNFKDPAKAANSWYATLDWLARYLKA